MTSADFSFDSTLRRSPWVRHRSFYWHPLNLL